MLPTKTCFAFEESAKVLFRGAKHIYFWTFTFVKVPWCDTIAMRRWDAFIKRLKEHHPFMKGLRVMELHRSHGIHFHVILNERVGIDLVKRLAKGHGFGRIAVKVADIGSVTYLSKYMTKSFLDQNDSLRSRRKWGTINFKATQCRDIVYETNYTRNRSMMIGKVQIGYAEHLIMSRLSHAYGDFVDWPLRVKVTFQQAMQAYGHKRRFI